MARLQDFNTVTPGASDKILIVQSQGQGLALHSIKLDSANPTGTGTLSLNRSGNTGTYSVAVGQNCTASGNNGSHAEGQSTTASGARAHAENYQTTASGDMSHAEGFGSVASGAYAHAEGRSTIANHLAQHTFGQYNVADPSTASGDSRGNYIEIVGKGTGDANRSNARVLDWSGNEVLAGDLTIKGSKSVNDAITPRSTSNLNLFFVFGSVKDGNNYYTNSLYIPMGYKLDENNITLPSGATLQRSGNFYNLYTASSSLAGKGTNIIASLIADT